MVILNFFIVNLFVGIIVSSYNRQKEKLDENILHSGKNDSNKFLVIVVKPRIFVE